MWLGPPSGDVVSACLIRDGYGSPPFPPLPVFSRTLRISFSPCSTLTTRPPSPERRSQSPYFGTSVYCLPGS
ncbi:hypothetical protein M404DRAFT_1005169 [Pisolithus tinctorius Marx 270]|uniref:Uncharacterized protein n=1 Tax=Pisolithus tinctorius Marx 270 TaxID=870435 RepID=A0A0C3ING4_PISTI|nr:hypothetical protein M404DRAFT_1005169 [Pisolithus tinctorius Marx 270]